ncbi:YhcB family protein [Glaesserella sp.]|uniref:YhcB family protein n=1 Tax=Glaesserella sp. TaxID=2094731 RepID=UPI0035A0CCCE
MEQWSGNVWTAIIAAFVVGLILGYVIFRATNANAQKQQKLEKDLKAATTQMEEQKQQLEQHFEQSATLLATLADDYKKLYSHLAKGSQTLLPEAEANKIEFFQARIESNTHPENPDDQPKDYSEGSSGILKS